MTDLIRSWVGSANTPKGDFPLNNLPYGVFSAGDSHVMRCGVAIGDRILDVTGLEAAGILRADPDADVLKAPCWNDFMALGPAAWMTFREGLAELLSEGAGAATRDWLVPHLSAMSQARLHLPFRVSEFTDFYAGMEHARNVGTMFRGAKDALPPNWLSMPIGYNGRASSVVISGTPVTRPNGQLKETQDDLPGFGASERFDFELELGAIVGQPSAGPVSVRQADEMIFGYVLLNDWSARDIQMWEYRPLGPFQAKATATTISPWIVTGAALEPFRTWTPERIRPLLPYLREPGPMLYDIALEVGLIPESGGETVIARTNYAAMYYSAAQQLAHHTSSGCPMRIGDLLGSGTVSGATKESRGSLLELSWNASEPVILATGQRRRFLEDGDTVILRGAAHGDGYRIGFGACTGTVAPAAELPDWARG